jgi:hypothetical protein
MNSTSIYNNNFFRLSSIPIYWAGSLGCRIVTKLRNCCGCTETTDKQAQEILIPTTPLHTISDSLPSQTITKKPSDLPLSDKVSAAAAGVFPETPKSSPLKIEWLFPLAEVPEWTRDPTHQNWSLCGNKLTMIRAKIGLPDQSELTVEQVWHPWYAEFLSDPNEPLEWIRLCLSNFSPEEVGFANCLFYTKTNQFYVDISVNEQFKGKGLGKALLEATKHLRKDLFDTTKEAIGEWSPKSDNFITFKTKFHERTQAPFPPCASKEEFDSLPSDTQRNLLFAASQTFTGKMYSNLFGFTPSHLTIEKHKRRPEEICKVEVSFLSKYPD